MQARGQTALFGGSMVCNCGFHAVKVMYKKMHLTIFHLMSLTMLLLLHYMTCCCFSRLPLSYLRHHSLWLQTCPLVLQPSLLSCGPL